MNSNTYLFIQIIAVCDLHYEKPVRALRVHATMRRSVVSTVFCQRMQQHSPTQRGLGVHNSGREASSIPADKLLHPVLRASHSKYGKWLILLHHTSTTQAT